MAAKRHADEVLVDEGLVRRLLRVQFPQWAELPLRLVEPSGTDHTIFRVGDELVARFPAVEYATQQVLREARWVPFLAAKVPLELSVPVALGEPGEGYPWSWSIVRWIDGERATRDNLDLARGAVDLAEFIRALQACDPAGGPEPGQTTSLRGRPLSVWDGRLDEWVAKLDGVPEIDAAVEAFAEGRAAPPWDRPPVWLHGDLTGNLIARDGTLVGVIDSGFAVGDPACDLMPGWSLFRGEDRRRFFEQVGLDDATILRSRAWTIAPALIGLSYYRDVPHLRENARSAIEGALAVS
jgi:aminoglycoside phosphotransferase (APT) family kinase protein